MNNCFYNILILLIIFAFASCGSSDETRACREKEISDPEKAPFFEDTYTFVESGLTSIVFIVSDPDNDLCSIKIDYFYPDSDSEPVRSETIGNLFNNNTETDRYELQYDIANCQGGDSRLEITIIDEEGNSSETESIEFSALPCSQNNSTPIMELETSETNHFVSNEDFFISHEDQVELGVQYDNSSNNNITGAISIMAH